MGKYRKIDPRIWNDKKFRVLSERGKLVFFFLLTHPHMTALGAMRETIPGLAAEFGIPEKAFREAFQEALQKGMVEVDENASFICLPKFIIYNPPESPNVLKAWESSVDLLPECELRAKHLQRVKAFAEGLPQGFAKVLPKAFTEGALKPMPNREQEQEQDIKEKVEREKSPPPSRKPSRPTRIPENFSLTETMVEYASKMGLNPQEEFQAFKDHHTASPKSCFLDWNATWRTWCRKAVQFGRSRGPSLPGAIATHMEPKKHAACSKCGARNVMLDEESGLCQICYRAVPPPQGILDKVKNLGRTIPDPEAKESEAERVDRLREQARKLTQGGTA